MVLPKKSVSLEDSMFWMRRLVRASTSASFVPLSPPRGESRPPEGTCGPGVGLSPLYSSYKHRDLPEFWFLTLTILARYHNFMHKDISDYFITAQLIYTNFESSYS